MQEKTDVYGTLKECLEKGFEWAAVDENGDIFLYKNEPVKTKWKDGHNFWDTKDDANYFYVASKFFSPQLKWEDEKPTRITDILADYDEKPIQIPDYVHAWFEEVESDLILEEVAKLLHDTTYDGKASQVCMWMLGHEKEFLKAFASNDYTIKITKKYRIYIRVIGMYLVWDNYNHYHWLTTGEMDDMPETYGIFSEEEIRRIEERLWPFAIEVD